MMISNELIIAFIKKGFSSIYFKKSKQWFFFSNTKKVIYKCETLEEINNLFNAV